MSYSTEAAKLLTDQLKRFVSLRVHQLAGQVENLDFWLDEVRHAISVIDGYGVRFVRLQSAQERYVIQHQVTVPEFDSAGGYSRDVTPSDVRRIPDRELQQARKSLVDVIVKFLDRCQHEGLIDTAVKRRIIAEFDK